jgi:murein DD-endopeptidase MepM/ murein hydrolase activator NlpD
MLESPGSARRRARHVALTAAVGVAIAALGAASVGAQIVLPTTTTTAPPQETTTTTAPQETTTTTQAPPPTLFPPSPTTTSTTVPPRPGTTQPPREEQGPPPPEASPTAGDGGTAPAGAGSFPPELQALMNSVVRTRANNTKALVAALAPLQQYGLDAAQAAVVGFGRFPVAGPASYSHDWWFPRFGPGWRLHQGTDIFAAHGTPVRAPVDGTIKITNGGLGGLSVYVIQADATYWYLTHLAGLAEGLTNGQAVSTGDVVGFVGDSGNARGGAPHLHFEVHPGGGGPIDPKPVLDQFIADALALAPQVVDAYAKAHQAGTEVAAVAPPVAPPSAPAIARALSPRAALLWTNAVSPEGGALHIAEAEAARVASSIDWGELKYGYARDEFEREIARRYAAWWVSPLVHPRLRAFLPTD